MSLPLKNTRSTYGLASISLHWIMALTIIGLYLLGLYIDTLDYYDPNYRTFPHWHKSIGIILLGFYVFRLAWNLINPHPEPLPQPPMAQLATKVVHKLMYLLIILVLVSGYLISTADGRAISVFSWFEIPAIPAILERQEDTAGFLHYWLATGLISLAGLHALAALKHHFINKDQTLNRMLGKAQSTQE